MEALIVKYEQAQVGRSFRAFMGKEKIILADKILLSISYRH